MMLLMGIVSVRQPVCGHNILIWYKINKPPKTWMYAFIYDSRYHFIKSWHQRRVGLCFKFIFLLFVAFSSGFIFKGFFFQVFLFFCCSHLLPHVFILISSTFSLIYLYRCAPLFLQQSAVPQFPFLCSIHLIEHNCHPELIAYIPSGICENDLLNGCKVNNIPLSVPYTLLTLEGKGKFAVCLCGAPALGSRG